MRLVLTILFICAFAAFSMANVTDVMISKLKKTVRLTPDQLLHAKLILKACSKSTESEDQLTYVLSTAIGESELQPVMEIRAVKDSSAPCTGRRASTGTPDTSGEASSRSHGSRTTRGLQLSSA